MSVGNGGGATHVAKVTGKLAELSENLSDILIVAGGGGGGGLSDTTPGNGGGYIGGKPKYNGTAVDNKSGTQNSGNQFGKGESGSNTPGAGGGLYGGYCGKASTNGAGSGSGYIANTLLSNKKMYGNDVPTSDTASTKTLSVGSKSSVAMSGKPKIGNGFVRIRYVGQAPVVVNDFFRPDLTSNGHDIIRNSSTETVTYFDNSAEYSSEQYYVGSLHDMAYVYSTSETWEIANSKLTGAYHGAYIWGYSTDFANQSIIPANCTVSIGMTIYGETLFGYIWLNDTNDCMYEMNFIDPIVDTGLYITIVDNNADTYTLTSAEADIADKKLPVSFDSETGTKIDYKLTLENGTVTKIEYYINDTLYNSFSTIPSSVKFFNVDHNDSWHNNAILIQCDEEAFLDDIHISYE